MDADGAFHFMEMNTRLQVEHPVTERITGLDLVDWQLQVAAGLPLPLGQEEIRITGAAIEARLYAEAPARGFLPSSGFLHHLRIPDLGAFAEAHLGVGEGDEVTPHYDPMLAKLVVQGADRAQALARLRRWLAAIEIVGPATNLDFLVRLTDHAEVIAGAGRHRLRRAPAGRAAAGGRARPAGPGGGGRPASGRAPSGRRNRRQHQPRPALALASGRWLAPQWRRPPDPAPAPGDRLVEVDAAVEGAGHRITVEGVQLRVTARLHDDQGGLVEIDGEVLPARLVVIGQSLHLIAGGGLGHVQLELDDPLATAAMDDDASGLLLAPMPGRIVSRPVGPGDTVRRGDPLLTMEAMKMEHTIRAPIDGRVVAVHVGEGEQVEEGVVLLDLEPVDD